MLHLLLALQVVAQHDALRYDVTLVPSDTGTHLLGEVETVWRLGSTDPVVVRLDSSMRVVRVLVDGRPNTRLSRTMYARSTEDVLVPHQKAAGDTITTRIRYHGLAPGLVNAGGAGAAGRPTFFAAAEGKGAARWLPVPERPDTDRVTATFRIQVPLDHRAIAPGVMVGADTLPYEHAVWRYELRAAVPIATLAAAAGPYQVRAPPGADGPSVWLYTGSGRAEPLDGGDHLGPPWPQSWPFEVPVHVEAAVPDLVAAPGVVFHPEGSLAGARDQVAPRIALGNAKQWFGVAVVSAPGDGDLTAGLARHLATLALDPTLREPAVGGADGAERDMIRALGALRKSAGDSAFFQGLRDVVESHRDRPLTRSSFVSAMSRATGRTVDLPRQGR